MIGPCGDWRKRKPLPRVLETRANAGVGVMVGVFVGVAVAVLVGVFVGVAVAVLVGVEVGVAVGEGPGVGVGVKVGGILGSRWAAKT